MDKRFANLLGLTEDQAIALLDTPANETDEGNSRYAAAAQLIQFPTERSINALIRAVQNTDPSLDNRIVRRKSIESLGRLTATAALDIIRGCLQETDRYTVENAVWAIGEIGTRDRQILEEIAQLLTTPNQTYRVILQTLAKLNYRDAIGRIQPFIDDSDPPTASAARTALYRLTGDASIMDAVVAGLQHASVNARRSCVQDLIDAQYHPAIPQITRCPVSVAFRLRAIQTLIQTGLAGQLTFPDVQPYLEQTLRDHPADLEMVHEYDAAPALDFLIRELYHTDFGRCYLAARTLITTYAEAAPTALLQTYTEEAHNDYGAHYHVIKLLGWFKHEPSYPLLIEALENRAPQFQKSRAAAAIALGELGNPQAIPHLRACLETSIWDLKYAALMALTQFGERVNHHDADWLVQAKANTLSSPTS